MLIREAAARSVALRALVCVTPAALSLASSPALAAKDDAKAVLAKMAAIYNSAKSFTGAVKIVR